jgi:hypothetical protein
MAIAFGLGGRNVAARLLEDAYRQGREQRDEPHQQRRTDARSEVPIARPTPNAGA